MICLTSSQLGLPMIFCVSPLDCRFPRPDAPFLCALLELSLQRYNQLAHFSPNLLRCGHCKQFAPEYEKIASTLKENDPPIPVAKIDATSESALASRFDVSGYPTIKILKKGQAVDYEGSRTQDGKWYLSCRRKPGRRF